MCCMYIEEDSGWTRGSACFMSKNIQWRESESHEEPEFQEEAKHLEGVKKLMEDKIHSKKKRLQEREPGYH